MGFKFYFWLLFLASLFSFLAPVRVVEEAGFGLDKVYHFVIFALLGYLGSRAFGGGIASSARGGLAMIVLLGTYAFGVEFIQHLLPWRSFDVWDAVAGVAGLAIVQFHRIVQREKS